MTNPIVLVAAVIVLAGLTLWLRHSREAGHFNEALARHRTSSMSSHAQMVDGPNHISVALMLEAQQICYENLDLSGSLDIEQIDEVEYGSDLLTGGIANGAVMRLRAHGRVMEFILDVKEAEAWSRHLPPHRANEAGIVHAV